MDTLRHFLGKFREPVPAWLDTFESGDRVEPAKFLSSRVVFYPGSGTDGQPVAAFSSAHAAHCFIYADYLLAQEDIRENLDHPRFGFIGYHTLARLQIDERDLRPNGWTAHVHQEDVRAAQQFAPFVQPFGFFEILERNPDRDEKHGARRLAILFLGADGIAAFDALFCQEEEMAAPFCAVLQDGGFDANYDDFGGFGLLERLAKERCAYPEFLLIAEGTKAWAGYMNCPCDSERGGVLNRNRSLYRRRQP